MEVELWQIGIILIFLGILLTFLGVLSSSTQKRTRVEAGFVGFIGPIPIGFATSKEMLYLALIISIIAIVLLLMYLKFLFQ